AVAQEQLGRVTNALGWGGNNPQSWMVKACSAQQIEKWVKPLIREEMHEWYANTEADAGSDVDGIQATARHEGGHYILNREEKHVTNYNISHSIIFQPKLTGGDKAGSHCLFSVEREAPGVEVVRTPAYSHTYRPHHPIVRFTDVKVPVENRIGAEGG